MNRKKVLFLFTAASFLSITTYGQALVNGQLQMSNIANNGDRRIVNIGTPLDTADAVNAASVQQNRVTYAASTGTANALFVNLPGQHGSYKAGTTVTFVASTFNTGAVTLDVNGWGPKNVFYNVNNPLIAGDIQAGQIMSVIYDGANFQTISPLAQQHDFSGVLQGDVTGGQHTTLIAPNAVTTVKLADSAATAIKIKGQAVNTVHIIDSAAIPVKIKGLAVNTVHLADSAVTPIKIKSASVASVHFADSAVTAVKIKSRSVANVHLRDSVATAPKIKGQSVATVHIIDSAATALKIKGQSVNTVHIVDNAVNSAKIADGTIMDADVSPTAAIPYSKLVLTNSVKGTDFTATAGSKLAYNKLALTGNIKNTDIATTAGIAYSKLTLTGAVTDNDVNSAAAIAYSKLNLAGNIKSTDLTANAATLNKISTTGAATGNAIQYDGANTVWATPTAGVGNVNGATGTTQTFATGTANNDFGINTNTTTNTHTFNLPDASSTARGAVTTGTQTFAGSKTLTGSVTASNDVSVNGNLNVAAATGNVTNAGKLIVGNTVMTANAAAEVASTTGAFVLPRMSSTQRDAITAPIGSMIYNTTTSTMQVKVPPTHTVAENNGPFFDITSNSTSTRGQTFTTTDTGKLSTISISPFAGTSGLITATFHSSIGGTILGTATATADGTGALLIFDFSAANITINNATQYYVTFIPASGNLELRGDLNGYTGGQMYLNDASDPGYLGFNLLFTVTTFWSGWVNL